MNFYQLLSNSSIVVATLVGGTIFSGCTDQDDATPNVPACLPTNMPAEVGDDEYLEITYNELGKPISLSNPDYQEYSFNVFYDDQNRLLSLGEEGDESYFLVEYTNGEIKETYYYQKDDGNYAINRFNIYKTDDQDRIISNTEYDVEDSGPEKEYTSEYTYDEQGNIAKVTGTNWVNDGEIRITRLMYDDKINPFHTVGFMLHSDGLFNFITLSKSNLVSIQRGEDDVNPDQLSYEYDTMGNPVKVTYHSHYQRQEFDSEGNKVGEPKVVVETYENIIVFTCR